MTATIVANTPAVEVTPAAQPAQQPAPQVQPEPQVVYQQVPTYTGNSTLETSINIFTASAGITPDRFGTAIEKAIEYGDASLINYAELTQGLKPDQAAQAKALAEAAFKEQTAQAQQFITAQKAQIEQLAGSAEAWQEAAQAFNQSAPEHLRKVVRQMLDNGDMVAAGQFVLETVRGSGMVNFGTAPLQGGTGGAGANVTGLSKREYFDKLNELNRKAGNSSWAEGTSIGEQLKTLQQLRQLGAKQGR